MAKFIKRDGSKRSINDMKRIYKSKKTTQNLSSCFFFMPKGMGYGGKMPKLKKKKKTKKTKK